MRAGVVPESARRATAASNAVEGSIGTPDAPRRRERVGDRATGAKTGGHKSVAFRSVSDPLPRLRERSFSFPPDGGSRPVAARRFGSLEPFARSAPERVRTSDLRFRRPRRSARFGSSKPTPGREVAKNSPENQGSHAGDGPGHLAGSLLGYPTDARYRRKTSARSTLPQTTTERPGRARAGNRSRVLQPRESESLGAGLAAKLSEDRRRVRGSAHGNRQEVGPDG
jgi:hypothetical protein